MHYELLKKLAAILFNIQNRILFGNLPPFACACVVVVEQNRYLVIERPGGELAFPGGFMRWDEHPEQTVQREGEEETGLQLHPLDVIGYYSLPSNRVTRMSVLTIVYIAEVSGGELRSSVEGRPLWVQEDQLLDKINPFMASILEDYRRYRQHPRSENVKRI